MTGRSAAARTSIAICVPARNEAASLPQFFASLERLDRRGLAPILCLHLDSCDDDSAAIAQGYVARASMPVWVDRAVQAEPNAGHARHRAMLLGARALGRLGVLLTTDADSAPDTHWLQAMIAALKHADVVAGRVVRSVTQPNPMQDRLERYYDALHAARRLLDPVTWEAEVSHHQTSGANLAISTGHYHLLGGFRSIPVGEDAQLVDDAARAGLRVRRDATSVVYTSDRRLGRVAHGFAAGLRALDAAGGTIAVAQPADATWQYRGHALARRAYDNGDMRVLADAIGLTQDHLFGV